MLIFSYMLFLVNGLTEWIFINNLKNTTRDKDNLKLYQLFMRVFVNSAFFITAPIALFMFMYFDGNLSGWDYCDDVTIYYLAITVLCTYVETNAMFIGRTLKILLLLNIVAYLNWRGVLA